MKELSIEEKAKAYDEAIERANDILKGYNPKEGSKATINYIFPQLKEKESEDERIRKFLIKWIQDNYYHGTTEIPTKTLIAWLEKQGEQKHINDTDEAIVKAVKDTSILDMVEPKFHEGDWVVDSQGLTHQIERVVENVTTHTFGYDIVGGGYFNNDNESVHLWTIQDAKDGDVLREDSCTFIIERMNPDGTAIVYCCLFDDGDFDLGSTLSFDIDSTKPATKEQRDFFFQKMKEKSYEWNAEKKELKKIKYRVCDEDKAEMDYCFTKMMNGEKVSEEDEEYNGEDYGIDSLYHAQRILEKTLGSVDGYQTDDGILSHKCAITAIKKLYKQKAKEWSDEDERMFDYALDMIEWYSGKNGDKSKLVSDWLKFLKDRAQPKHEWSEEDEARLQSCLNILQAKGFMGITETINTKWLKSLKNRVQSKPQWKPSDEQLYILHWLATNVLVDGVVDKKASEILYTLYDDLKKLTRE